MAEHWDGCWRTGAVEHAICAIKASDAQNTPAPAPPARMSDVLTRRKFETLADCATGYLVNDDTTGKQMGSVMAYHRDLLAHDAEMRSEVERLRKERDRLLDNRSEDFVNLLVRFNAAEARADALQEEVNRLKKELGR